MRNLGSNLMTFGFGLIVVVVGIQFLWSILLQYETAIILGLFILGGVVAVRIYRKRKYPDDDLLIR